MKPVVHSNVSLKPLNTFGIDVNARYYTEIASVEDLQNLLNEPPAKTIPHFILGGGSNILFTQNLENLVIRVAISGIHLLHEDQEHVWLEVGAGENWHQLVMHCVKHNWSGIENLSLIPGTVGGAPIQNIGAYGVELKDVIVEIRALQIENGLPHVFKNEVCKFGYRDSIFKNSHKNQFIITSIVLRLNKNHNFHIGYSALAEALKTITKSDLNIKAISDAVIKIRQSKLPNPAEVGNAGSFFKNPEISKTDFLVLQDQYSDITHYSLDDDRVKIPAAWLIEQCGWKGKRCGNIGVYPKQALVLVNYGQGTGLEIKKLAEEIQNSVYQKFSIRLTTEVNII